VAVAQSLSSPALDLGGSHCCLRSGSQDTRDICTLNKAWSALFERVLSIMMHIREHNDAIEEIKEKRKKD